MVVVQQLAEEGGFFGNEPILLVLFVAIVLIHGSVGTLSRIALDVEVALFKRGLSFNTFNPTHLSHIEIINILDT